MTCFFIRCAFILIDTTITCVLGNVLYSSSFVHRHAYSGCDDILLIVCPLQVGLGQTAQAEQRVPLVQRLDHAPTEHD